MALRVVRPASIRDDRLILTEEVAARLNVTPKTIRRWVAKAGLPCIRLGGKLQFLWSQVLRWVIAKSELAEQHTPAVDDIMRKLGLCR